MDGSVDGWRDGGRDEWKDGWMNGLKENNDTKLPLKIRMQGIVAQL